MSFEESISTGWKVKKCIPIEAKRKIISSSHMKQITSCSNKVSTAKGFEHATVIGTLIDGEY